MKVIWAGQMTGIGNAFGYTSHSKNLKAGLERAGLEFTWDPAEADFAVHIITPDKFNPIPGVKNVLFTMYETTSLPPDWIDPIQKADLLVVPCKQNKVLFQQYYKGPIEVDREGVDLEHYTYKERQFPKDKPFQFLWVGAPNPRKGFQHVGLAWEIWLKKYPNENCWLYCKSSGVEKDKADKVTAYGKAKMTIDTRNLPLADLVKLYHDAHAFLLPSMGEGFGLTLAEAMATGLPCVFTPWGGPQDFAGKNPTDTSCGYPVEWKFAEVKTIRFRPDGSQFMDNQSYAASAELPSIIQRMEQIYFGYEKALEKGKNARQRIEKDFTWDRAAQEFIEILERHREKKAA